MSKDPTTPDLVELVRGLFEAVNCRDLDAVMRVYAPDAVLELTGMGTSVEGVAAIRRFYEDWQGAFELWQTEPEELLDLGNGVVFAAVRQSGRPVGTVGHVQQREAWAVVWMDGLIGQHMAYFDIDEARAAAERLAEERGRATPEASGGPCP